MSRLTILAICLLCLLARIQAQATVTVPTNFGSIIGLSNAESNEFLGIPYAQPPVNNLRFAPPVPWTPPQSNYVINATKYGSACMQSKSPIYHYPGTPSEDCLYLNIWAPKIQNAQTHNLPVMLFIHGGGFRGGSGNEPKYNGSTLASERGVIVITINYRLGAFGFLADESFCAADPNCGMWGILDQQAAMKWTQTYISWFGGNPNNVTIFGESAGGMSVIIQLAQQETQGLFHRAIVESGVSDGYPSLETAEGAGAALVGALGCLESGSISCMRSEPAENILEKQSDCSDPNCWWPAINGYNLWDQPINMIASGKYHQAPVMIGCNGNEGYLFALGFIPIRTERKYEKVVMENFGEFGEQVLIEYPYDNYSSGFDAVEAVIADYLFTSTINYLVEAMYNGNTLNPSVHVYLFNHTPSYVWESAGAFHGSELPFVFGFRDGLLHFTQAEEMLSQNMTTYWTNFARTGNPNPAGSNIWPAFTPSETARIVLNTGDAGYLYEFRNQQSQFWKQYYAQYYPERVEPQFLKSFYLGSTSFMNELLSSGQPPLV